MPTIDVRDFATADGSLTSGIQEAINALPVSGGDVHIPSGIFPTTGTIYMPCDRPCNLIGSGASINDTHGTVIVGATGADIIRLRGDFSSVRNLRLSGAGSSAAANEETGRGIVIGRRNIADPHPNGLNPANTEVTNGGASAGILTNPTIEDVRISGTSGWGVFISGFTNLSDGATPESGAIANGTLSIFGSLRRVYVRSPLRYGGIFTGGGTTTTHVEDCQFVDANNGGGKAGSNAFYAYLAGCEKIIFEHCTFEGFCPGANPWVQAGASFSVDLLNCWFEEDAGDANAAAPTWFITNKDGMRGLSILNPHMQRNSITAAGRPRLIQLVGNARGVVISNIFCQMGVPGNAATAVYTAPNWVEQNHVDLGTSDNVGSVLVLGTGTIWDVSGSGVGYNVQYANIPAFSMMTGGQIMKVPVLTIAQRDATTQMPWPNGTVILVSDGTAVGLQIRRAGAWYHFGAGTVNGGGD